MSGDGHRRLLAVIGYPVAHSRSPVMQNAALRATGLGDTWSYGAIEIPPQEAAGRIRELARDGRYAGINVTVPHKQVALEVADSASDAASRIGAANTLVFSPSGAIHAENTDAPGLIDAIGDSPDSSKALVLGAGGAARAVVWALDRAGADVHIWARRPEKAAQLASELGGKAWQPGEGGVRDGSDFDLIVNASAAGLADGRALQHLPVDPSRLRSGQTVVDMVYGEQATDLTVAARRAGSRVVDGLEILVRQGARSFTIWTGLEAPLEVMRRTAAGSDR